MVDGTLLPCWSWAAHADLYPGEHKTTGMKVLVACTLDGRLSWGFRSDSREAPYNYCLGESGILPGADPRNRIGEKGFAVNGDDNTLQEASGR
jgi:hypothetical protein